MLRSIIKKAVSVVTLLVMAFQSFSGVIFATFIFSFPIKSMAETLSGGLVGGAAESTPDNQLEQSNRAPRTSPQTLPIELSPGSQRGVDLVNQLNSKFLNDNTVKENRFDTRIDEDGTGRHFTGSSDENIDPQNPRENLIAKPEELVQDDVDRYEELQAKQDLAYTPGNSAQAVLSNQRFAQGRASSVIENTFLQRNNTTEERQSILRKAMGLEALDDGTTVEDRVSNFQTIDANCEEDGTYSYSKTLPVYKNVENQCIKRNPVRLVKTGCTVERKILIGQSGQAQTAPPITFKNIAGEPSVTYGTGENGEEIIYQNLVEIDPNSYIPGHRFVQTDHYTREKDTSTIEAHFLPTETLGVFKFTHKHYDCQGGGCGEFTQELDFREENGQIVDLGTVKHCEKYYKSDWDHKESTICKNVSLKVQPFCDSAFENCTANLKISSNPKDHTDININHLFDLPSAIGKRHVDFFSEQEVSPQGCNSTYMSCTFPDQTIAYSQFPSPEDFSNAVTNATRLNTTDGLAFEINAPSGYLGYLQMEFDFASPRAFNLDGGSPFQLENIVINNTVNSFTVVSTSSDGSISLSRSNNGLFYLARYEVPMPSGALTKFILFTPNISGDVFQGEALGDVKGLYFASGIRPGVSQAVINFSGVADGKLTMLSTQTAGADALFKQEIIETPPGCASDTGSVSHQAANGQVYSLQGAYIDTEYEAVLTNGFDKFFQCIEENNSKDVGGLIITPEEHGSYLIPLHKEDNPKSSICYKAKIEDFYVDEGGLPYCELEPENCGTEDASVTWAEKISSTPSQCKQYEDDDKCSFSTNVCESPQGVAGGILCHQQKNTYMCLIEDGNKTEQVQMEGTCSLAKSCQEVEEVNEQTGLTEKKLVCPYESETENSRADFANLSVQMSVVEQGANDMYCFDPSDPSTCTMFNGEMLECRKSAKVTGKNCCKEVSSQINPVQYVLAAREVYQNQFVRDTAYYVWQLGAETSVGSWIGKGWSTLSTTVSNMGNAAYDAVVQPIVDFSVEMWSKVYTSVTGNAAATATTGAASGAVTGAGGEAVVVEASWAEGAKQWTYETIHNLTGDLIVEETTNQVTGEAVYQLSSGMTSVMAVVAYVYYVYLFVSIVYSFFDNCGTQKDEDKTFLKIPMGACVQGLRSYCSADSIFGCLERTHQNCCYNSMLARIVNEQGSAQLGRSLLGNGCKGLTLDEMAQIDFSQIDFSEWEHAYLNGINYNPNMADIETNATKEKLSTQFQRVGFADGDQSQVELSSSALRDRKYDSAKMQTDIESDMFATGRVTAGINEDTGEFVKSKGLAPYDLSVLQRKKQVVSSIHPYEGEVASCKLQIPNQSGQSMAMVRVKKGLYYNRSVTYKKTGANFFQSGDWFTDQSQPVVYQQTDWTPGESNNSTVQIEIYPDGKFKATETDHNVSCTGQLEETSFAIDPEIEALMKHPNEGVVKSCTVDGKEYEATISGGTLFTRSPDFGNQWRLGVQSYGSFGFGSSTVPTELDMSGDSYQCSQSSTSYNGIKAKLIGNDRIDVHGRSGSGSYWGGYTSGQTCNLNVNYERSQNCVIDLSAQGNGQAGDVLVESEDFVVVRNQIVQGACTISIGANDFIVNHDGYVDGPKTLSITHKATGSEDVIASASISGDGVAFGQEGVQIGSSQIYSSLPENLSGFFSNYVPAPPVASLSVQGKYMSGTVTYNGITRSCSATLY